MNKHCAKYLIIAVVASVLYSCDSGRQPEQQSLMEISKQELADAIEERDRLLSLVKEVSAGMRQIRQLESVALRGGHGSGEMTDSNSNILSDIAAIKRATAQRKALLDEMEAKLENSTINNKELHETLDALRMQIDAQMEELELLRLHLIDAHSRIGMLNTSVDSLNTAVSEAEQDLLAARDSSAQLENNLNACYYIIASKSELKRNHILESGFMRRTQVLKGEFNPDCFTRSDKRRVDTLPLNSRKARILTNHPEASYEITDTAGSRELRIKNPALFWSLSNYLIVQTD